MLVNITFIVSDPLSLLYYALDVREGGRGHKKGARRGKGSRGRDKAADGFTRFLWTM